MVRPATRKGPAGLSLAPWVGGVLLASGLGIGWGTHALLSRNSPADAALECPPQPEPAPAPVCPTAAESEPPEGTRLPVYASEVTGEGVIEFKFYGPDGTEVTRKWTTRIPLSAPAEATPDADTQTSSPAPESEKPAEATKPATKTDNAAQSETRPSTKPAPAAKANEKKPAAKPTGKGKYTVQTGAYKDRESAEEQVAKLERRGFDARIEKATIPGKGTWYRVRVGSHLAQSEANTLAGKIRKAAGLEASAVVQ